MTRIQTLDGWRGVAISLVLFNHGIAALRISSISTGPHGVTLFFVLSGFLITSRFRSEKLETGTINLQQFYRRRCFRLMPVAWLYLFVAFLISPNSSDRTRGTIASLLFFRNFIHIDGISLTGHFWSLSIEEQFYLFWPLLLILCGVRAMPWILGLSVICLSIWKTLEWNTLDPNSFARTDFHVDALLIGCLAALLLPHIKGHLASWMLWPTLVYAIWCVGHFTEIIPTRESVAIALLLMITSTCGASILELSFIRGLGLISYSVYIWQQPFMYIHYGSIARALCALIAVISIATASYWFVEKPMIAVAHGQEKPQTTLVGSC